MSILADPKNTIFSQAAPDLFKAVFETTAGVITLELNRQWAPKGVDRFHALAKHGFFEGIRFFRVIRGFMAQFGIHPDPAIAEIWRDARIVDDPVVESNRSGTISFATAGPHTRTTQLFINLVNNSRLDDMGFAPIGKVVDGLSVVESLYADYGEGAPQGIGPEQGRIQSEGESYLHSSFPELDKILKGTIIS
jgi:peptidyl-prolyl cis-trans isomerase A (cyclophilin A)